MTFVVVGEAGQLQGGITATGLDGTANAARWILGITPGPNRVDAVVLGHQPVAFSATGILASVTSGAATTPTTLTGFFGNFVSAAPTVVLRDAQGNPVAGSSVSFELLQADGQVVGVTQVTDFLGRAILGGWRLGSGASQSVRATGARTPGLRDLTFTSER